MIAGVRSAICGERMPHGSPVRFDGAKCFLEPDLRMAEGVTKRPALTEATHHAAGEPVSVQVDGGILAELPAGEARWPRLDRGRIDYG